MKKGFTLFELLISISIIGILVALGVVSYSVAQKKARDTKRMQDMKAIQSAAEVYYSASNFTYPLSAGTSWVATGNNQMVLESFPKDPRGADYACTGLGVGSTGYCCCAQLEDLNSGNSADESCTFGVGQTGLYFCIKNQQ